MRTKPNIIHDTESQVVIFSSAAIYGEVEVKVFPK